MAFVTRLEDVGVIIITVELIVPNARLTIMDPVVQLIVTQRPRAKALERVLQVVHVCVIQIITDQIATSLVSP